MKIERRKPGVGAVALLHPLLKGTVAELERHIFWKVKTLRGVLSVHDRSPRTATGVQHVLLQSVGAWNTVTLRTVAQKEPKRDIVSAQIWEARNHDRFSTFTDQGGIRLTDSELLLRMKASTSAGASLQALQRVLMNLTTTDLTFPSRIEFRVSVPVVFGPGVQVFRSMFDDQSSDLFVEGRNNSFLEARVFR